jgi:hypothetical protein
MLNLKARGRQMAAFTLALAVGVPVAWACTTDYDGIIAAVDWSDVVTGIVAVAALIAAVLVVMKGSRMLLRMIGR